MPQVEQGAASLQEPARRTGHGARATRNCLSYTPRGVVDSECDYFRRRRGGRRTKPRSARSTLSASLR